MQTHPEVRPKRCCKVRAIVPPDIHIFYPLTVSTKKIDDAEVFEVSTAVISEINAVDWVVACCSPMISFAPDLSGNDPISGSSRFPGHWTEVGCCEKQK